MAEAIDEGMEGPRTQMVVCWGGQVEPGGDVVAHVEQQVEVLFAALARLDALHDLLQPARALAARRALPARLPGEELGDAPGRPAPRQVWSSMTTTEPEPSMEPASRHLVLPQGEVDLVGTEPRGGHAAGDERLQLTAVADAAAQDRGVDEVVEGGLHHLHLEDAGLVDVTGQGEQPGAGGAPLARGRRRRRHRGR